ncbi:MAG: hypothetical protein K8J08_16560 [Thermoanaerobaculia bacterium]|nr:hypothetical protein [Thermoanaerobaculia bacterium]
MTKRHSKTTLPATLAQQWLQAERDGADGAAQRSLYALFAAQPDVMPKPGFADRVVARVAAEGSTVVEGVESVKRRLPLELMAALLFLGTGLALRLAPYWLQPVIATVELPTWPTRLVQFLGGFGTSSLAFLEGAAESLRLSRVVLTSPQGAMFIAACVAVAVLSARLLYGLLDERGTDHV